MIELSGLGGTGRGVQRLAVGRAEMRYLPRKAGAGAGLMLSFPRAGGGLRPPGPRDAHYGSTPAAPVVAAICAGSRAGASVRGGWGAGARHHPLLSRQLLECRPRQVHGLRVVPGATAQRLLPRLCFCPSSLFPAVVAHTGGCPEPGPCAGASFWLPGLETVPQEREIYHPHRGDRWGGLSWRGTDPVTMSVFCQEAAPIHHSFIHSFWSQPLPPRHNQSQAAPTTGVCRDG